MAVPRARGRARSSPVRGYGGAGNTGGGAPGPGAALVTTAVTSVRKPAVFWARTRMSAVH